MTTLASRWFLDLRVECVWLPWNPRPPSIPGPRRLKPPPLPHSSSPHREYSTGQGQGNRGIKEKSILEEKGREWREGEKEVVRGKKGEGGMRGEEGEVEEVEVGATGGTEEQQVGA